MSYLAFKFTTGDEKSAVRLYPLACLHIGAAQSDIKFIKEHIARIKNDPIGQWIYMGDGGEYVTKHSKGGLYEQLMSPQLQMEMLIDLLGPIKEKGLFGVRGNHGNRVFKETGLSFDANLCHRLGIPYCGAATMANFRVNRSSYDGYFHHGIDSGVALSSKIAKAEQFGKFINTDMIVTAHSHVAIALQPAALLGCDNDGKKATTKLRYPYICGSAYDSRTGYAEEKGYPPLLPSFIVIELDGRIIEGKAIKKQDHKIYYSDGQHELKHDYLVDYLNRGGQDV